MYPIQMIVVAVSLAMDAFAVSVSLGLRMNEATWFQKARVSTHFGGFQCAMPILGWLAGRTFHHWIAACDHWVAFGLLSAIGLKMLWEGLTARGSEIGRRRGLPSAGELVLLSFAISIDALAVGVGVAMLKVAVWLLAVVAGVVTVLLSSVGLKLGKKARQHLGPASEVLGGGILFAIGIKILLGDLT